MGSIYFADNPLYMSKAFPIYEKVLNNEVGSIIVGEIKSTDRDLTFMPRDAGKVAVAGRCNADTHAENAADGAPKGVSGAGPALWFRGNQDNPRTPEDEREDLMPNGITGTGKGSDVTIFFDPDALASRRCSHGNPGTMPDEILIHEMVHALRFMQGRANPWPTTNHAYTNDEEFLAIVIANVYISAYGGLRLRANHEGHQMLQAPLNTSAGFLTNADNLRLMKIYRLLWSYTFNRLALLVKPWFNPFRELVRNYN